MPFYKIGHATFLEALKLLHPGVEVPSAEQLSTVFLGHAFKRSIKIATVTLGGKIVTLVTDCWTDTNGKAVVNNCAVCGIYTFFLESAYAGTQSHDAVVLTADVERVIANGAQCSGPTAAEHKTVKTLIKSRFDFIYGDAHGLAYLLDLRYGGINMDNCVRGAVEVVLEEWHGKEKGDAVIVELVAYHRHVRELKAKSLEALSENLSPTRFI
ncbi:hypothetical protein PI124_g12608 [Phytophthora idaei]|nr:hypothetical protein PI125_g6886 [Phytophthora idaei]KAG3161487.1 hypothetical protein PI126_g6436 [Phytophthora idaei]KAG3242548.1 hypothetical protein PI124_g12608 [Phytophthora idaei]